MYSSIVFSDTDLIVNSEDNLNLSINKTEVKQGESFSLEVEVINPLNKTVQGGITVSFSADVEVKENEDIKSGQTKIYPKGAKVYGAGHKCCITTENLMVEKWYKKWPANTKQKMNLEFSVVQNMDSLKIYARAAFIENLKKRKVINIPKDFDQQKYLAYDLAHITSVSVKKSSKAENVKKLPTLSVKSEEKSLIPPKPDVLEAELPDFEKPLILIDRSFRARLITGLLYSSHTSPLLTEKVSDYIPFYGVGLSTTFAEIPIIGNFSLDGYAQRTDRGIYRLFEESELTDRDSRFQRTDYAVTLGHKIEKMTNWISLDDHELSVFIGYKWGETSIDNVEIKLGEQRITDTNIDLDTKGFFVGFGYVLPLDVRSNKKLGFYYSYGKLTGNYYYTLNANAISDDKSLSPFFSDKGDITIENKKAGSQKIGIYFNGIITRSNYGKLTYGISLDRYQYMIGSVSNRAEGGPIEEEVYGVSASINWTFD